MTARRVVLVAALVFLLALGLRAWYLVQLSATPYADERELISDTAYYDMRAREIAAGDWLGDAPAFLSPFYCLFLGAVYRVTGPSLIAARAVQALVGALSCLLLYLVARRVFDERVGRVAAAILALYGPHVYYGGILLPDTLSVLLHLALAGVLLARPRAWTALAAGAIVGLAVLTKTNAVLLVPAIATLWLVTCRSEPLGRRLGWSALLAAAAACTIAPVTVANARVSGRFLLVATTSGENLLKGNGPTANGTHTFLPLGTQFTGLRAHLDHQVEPATAVEQSHAMSRAARRYMVEHPLRTLGLFAKKLLLLLNARELGIRDHYAFARTQIPLLGWPLLAFWAVVPLGLTGAIFACEERRKQVVLLAVLIVQVVSFVLVFVLARYRLVAVAFLAPFAARQLLWMIDRAREWTWRRLGASVAVLVAFLAIALWPASEFPGERGLADQHKFLADSYQARETHERAVEHYRAALDSDWQDGRRALPLRWETMLGLTRSLVALDRVADAVAVLEDLSSELEAAHPDGRSALQLEAEELRRALD